MPKLKRPRLRADFNGLFGSMLFLSHGDSSLDEHGETIVLHEGMKVTAHEDDLDAEGNSDGLFASGVVVPAPEWLLHKGSRWVLQMDEHGVRHESDAVAG
jgi:hypothetical protein